MTADPLEAVFWEFDARRKGYGDWASHPQSERDAFKVSVCYILAKERRRAQLEGQIEGMRIIAKQMCTSCRNGNPHNQNGDHIPRPDHVGYGALGPFHCNAVLVVLRSFRVEKDLADLIKKDREGVSL